MTACFDMNTIKLSGATIPFWLAGVAITSSKCVPPLFLQVMMRLYRSGMTCRFCNPLSVFAPVPLVLHLFRAATGQFCVTELPFCWPLFLSVEECLPLSQSTRSLSPSLSLPLFHLWYNTQVIVPILLSIVVLCFYWAIFLPYAANGIIHLFSPSWGMM